MSVLAFAVLHDPSLFEAHEIATIVQLDKESNRILSLPSVWLQRCIKEGFAVRTSIDGVPQSNVSPAISPRRRSSLLRSVSHHATDTNVTESQMDWKYLYMTNNKNSPMKTVVRCDEEFKILIPSTFNQCINTLSRRVCRFMGHRVHLHILMSNNSIGPMCANDEVPPEIALVDCNCRGLCLYDRFGQVDRRHNRTPSNTSAGESRVSETAHETSADSFSPVINPDSFSSLSMLSFNVILVDEKSSREPVRVEIPKNYEMTLYGLLKLVIKRSGVTHTDSYMISIQQSISLTEYEFIENARDFSLEDIRLCSGEYLGIVLRTQNQLNHARIYRCFDLTSLQETLNEVAYGPPASNSPTHGSHPQGLNAVYMGFNMTGGVAADDRSRSSQIDEYSKWWCETPVRPSSAESALPIIERPPESQIIGPEASEPFFDIAPASESHTVILNLNSTNTDTIDLTRLIAATTSSDPPILPAAPIVSPNTLPAASSASPSTLNWKFEAKSHVFLAGSEGARQFEFHPQIMDWMLVGKKNGSVSLIGGLGENNVTRMQRDGKGRHGGHVGGGDDEDEDDAGDEEGGSHSIRRGGGELCNLRVDSSPILGLSWLHKRNDFAVFGGAVKGHIGLIKIHTDSSIHDEDVGSSCADGSLCGRCHTSHHPHRQDIYDDDNMLQENVGVDGRARRALSYMKRSSSLGDMHIQDTLEPGHESSYSMKTHSIGNFPHLSSITVNCTDDFLLASGFSTDLGLFDISTGKMVSLFESMHSNYINIVRFANHSPHLFATSSFDGTAKLWDLRCCHHNHHRQTGTSYSSNNTSYRNRALNVAQTPTLNVMCSFSQDDSRLLVSGLDSAVTQFSVQNGLEPLDVILPISPKGSATNYRRSLYFPDRQGSLLSHHLVSGRMAGHMAGQMVGQMSGGASQSQGGEQGGQTIASAGTDEAIVRFFDSADGNRRGELDFTSFLDKFKRLDKETGLIMEEPPTTMPAVPVEPEEPGPLRMFGRLVSRLLLMGDRREVGNDLERFNHFSTNNDYIGEYVQSIRTHYNDRLGVLLSPFDPKAESVIVLCDLIRKQADETYDRL